MSGRFPPLSAQMVADFQTGTGDKVRGTEFCTFVKHALDKDAAVAAGHVLGRLEAEACHVPDGADHAVLIVSEETLRVVFDDSDAVLARQFHNRIHIADIPIQMHRYNRFASFVDKTLSRFHTDAMVIDVDVGKTRNRARLNH